MTFSIIDELLIALFRGGIVAGFAISPYIGQKRSERRANRRAMAEILRNEVDRIFNANPCREERTYTEPRLANEKSLVPSNHVYLGLLQTGNIQFFNKGLQDNLHAWYGDFENFSPAHIDVDLGMKIMGDLDRMEEANRSYLQVVRSTAAKLARR